MHKRFRTPFRCPGFTLGLLLLLQTPSGAFGGAPTAAEIYREYQRESLNLTRLAQIEAWLGFLKQHPDAPERAAVVLRLRMLAAELNAREEVQLIGALALEQLPDRLMGTSSLSLRLQALDEFALQFPEVLELGPKRSQYLALLARMEVEDPEAHLARVLRGESATALSEPKAPPTGSPAGTPDATPTPGPDVAAGEAPGAEVESVQGALATSEPSSAPQTSEDIASSSQALTGDDGTQIAAMVPSGTSGTQAAVLDALSGELRQDPGTEEARYRRWQQAAAGAPPQEVAQLWTFYLLLYPETQREEEILTRISEARQRSDEARGLEDAEAKAREAALRMQVQSLADRQSRDDETRSNRRAFFGTVAGVVGGILLLALLL